MKGYADITISTEQIATTNNPTSYGNITTPTVAADGTAKNLGSIVIKFDVLGASAAGANAAIVTLPNDLVLSNNSADYSLCMIKDDGGTSGLFGSPGSVTRLSDRELNVSLSANNSSYGVWLALTLNNVTVNSTRAAGLINATITKLSGQLPSGTVTVGAVEV